MSKLKKAEVLHGISEKCEGVTIRTTENILDAAAAFITERIAAGDEVTLPGLGTFSVKTRAGRVGKNPVTGEAVNIPEKKVPAFKATKTLKDVIGAIDA